MNEDNSIPIYPDDRFEPCRVCGEQSSGWHCGAVTCEACKKFFLRSLNGEDAKYKCLRNQECVIVRTTRTQCQFCRFQKCLKVGMTTAENPNSPKSADIFKCFPCTVCAAPSSGMHFGAVTCEGCKGFFRRSIKERAPERYKCLEAGSCEINVSTRNMCRYCRFQKCINAGMSSGNSRIGRQSNLFKHNIMQYQSKGLMPNYFYLISQRKSRRNKIEIPLGIKDEEKNFDINQDKNQDYNFYMEFAENISNTQNINNSNTTNLNMLQSNVSINNLNIYYTWPINNTDSNKSKTSSCIEDLLDADIRDKIKIIYRSYNEYLGRIVKVLKAELNRAHNLNTLNNNNTANNINMSNNSNILSKIQNNNQLQNNYNSQNSNSSSHSRVFVDIMEHLKFYFRKFSNFSENIGVLGELTSSDKEELIRNSIHSVILLTLQRDCDYLNYFNCEQARFEKITKIFPVFTKTISYMKYIHDKFKKFDLDDKEYALCSVLLLISSASTYLDDYDKIEEIRQNIGSALRQYMFARRNEETICDEILTFLVMIRKYNSNIQNGIKLIYYNLIQKDESTFEKYKFFHKAYLPNKLELN